MPERPQIICLPPAGGGPGVFRPWRLADPAVAAPTIPGRESRFREPPAADMNRLADRLAIEMAPILPARYGFFGYSMGGTVAFLLARRFAAMGLPGPEAFFVLGAPPPDRLDDGTASFHKLHSEAFWAEISRLGGTPEEILRDPEMRALFEPALRQDFRLCESYRHEDDGFRLACPIHVFVGDADHLVSEESASGWTAFAAGPARLHRLPGGHMLGQAAFAALRERLRTLWPDTPERPASAGGSRVGAG